MDTQKARFISNKSWMAKNYKSLSTPVPSSKSLPEWYINADRYAKDPEGKYYKEPDNGKVLTWKSCHAFFDAMISGYMVNTPCDVEFYLNKENKIVLNVAMCVGSVCVCIFTLFIFKFFGNYIKCLYRSK
jgi:hypothetical protein